MPDLALGQIWWADPPQPRRSEPGFFRPVLVIQADSFNRSRIQTVTITIVTGSLRLATAPGNVMLPARASGLPRDSVVSVSQLMTLDRGFLAEPAGMLTPEWQSAVDRGLRLALEL